MRRKKPFLSYFFFFFLGTTLLLSVLGIRDYLFHSSFFQIKEFDLELVGPVFQEEKRKRIREKIEKFLASSQGSSIFLLDIHMLRKELLDFPEIKTVELQRKLPDRLEIYAELDRPVAIVQGEPLTLINSRGQVYRQLEKGEDISLPIITVERGGALESLAPERIQGALALIAWFKNSSILEEDSMEEIFLRGPNYSGVRPMELTMRLFPKKVTRSVSSNMLTVVQWKESNLVKQTKRLELLIKTLLEQNKIPSLVRMGLGKKIIVKIAQ